MNENRTQKEPSSGNLWTHSVTSDARKFFSPLLKGPLEPYSWLSETGGAPGTRKQPFSSSRSMESHLIPASDRKWPLCPMNAGLLISSEIEPGIVWLSDEGKGEYPSGECGWSFLENNQWSQRNKEGRKERANVHWSCFCGVQSCPWSSFCLVSRWKIKVITYIWFNILVPIFVDKRSSNVTAHQVTWPASKIICHCVLHIKPKFILTLTRVEGKLSQRLLRLVAKGKRGRAEHGSIVAVTSFPPAAPLLFAMCFSCNNVL